MIEIGNVPQRQAFPVLDFKFVNSGHAAAVMWKFAIVIEQASIDPTPDFRGRAEVLVELNNRDPSRARFPETTLLPPNRLSFGQYLAISVENTGWGLAENAALV